MATKQPTPTGENIPSSESQWGTAQPATELPPHEAVVSPTRAVQESFARLGVRASLEDVERELEQLGVRADRSLIEKVKADMERACAACSPLEDQPKAATRPQDLVLTEGERVPPPAHPS